jgi:hypothetical protein
VQQQQKQKVERDEAAARRAKAESAAAAAEEEKAQAEAAHGDAAAIMKVVNSIGGDVKLCVKGVPARDLRMVLYNIGATFEGTSEAVKATDWYPDAVLPSINQQIGAASTAMGTSLKAQLAVHGALGDGETTAQMFVALSQMAGAMAGRGVGGGGVRSASAADLRVNEAVLAAAERLSVQGADQTLANMQQMAMEAGKRLHKSGRALRTGCKAALLGPYGSDIALIMNQEKLEPPKGATISPSASRVWSLLCTAAQRLREAVMLHYRKLLPDGIKAEALVTALACGKLTVALMVPAAATAAAKSDKAAAEVRMALMRAWPVVMAILAEVNPRDESAQDTLLKMSLDVFNPLHVVSDPVEMLMKPALEEMRVNYARYLLDGGDEPTWKAAAADSERDALASMALRGNLQQLGQPAAGGLNNLTTEQQRVRAAANAAAAEKRGAAAAGKQPAANEPPWMPDDKYADMSTAEKEALYAKRASAKGERDLKAAAPK